ncbi:hypothetical protein [Paenibacillus radicis (ex Xue et al. 2023)]|uniref:Uncharacterized protein n=1 Tax=Paenibacillus radicis (ex Xue et al. 2023) TaxID=2972489 RepID=A0ABT1YL23_9BACL|nr:hypothetical protein [Paenibacillus radicis (ex Xue et al. 2023)]MCR8633889.1 hypothetical protein [Paenibacillus radicis (ex Xue et al. 2023)]
MIFDYCELESIQSGQLTIIAGCRFADEPDELYVVQLDTLQDGTVQELGLYFNGNDCKYSFKQEERALIKDYVLEKLAATEYANWFQGDLKL